VNWALSEMFIIHLLHMQLVNVVHNLTHTSMPNIALNFRSFRIFSNRGYKILWVRMIYISHQNETFLCLNYVLLD
jgi:hypothetical protein